MRERKLSHIIAPSCIDQNAVHVIKNILVHAEKSIMCKILTLSQKTNKIHPISPTRSQRRNLMMSSQKGMQNTKNLASVRCAIKIIPFPLKKELLPPTDSVIVPNGELFHSKGNLTRLWRLRVAPFALHGSIQRTNVMLEGRNVDRLQMVKTAQLTIRGSSMG